jgi:hypothetical protein
MLKIVLFSLTVVAMLACFVEHSKIEEAIGIPVSGALAEKRFMPDQNVSMKTADIRVIGQPFWDENGTPYRR